MTFLQTVFEYEPLYPLQLTFLFVTLPLCLLTYYLLPARYRPAALLVMSAAFCLVAKGPAALLLMAGSVAADLALFRAMERWDESPAVRKLCLRISIGKNLGLILLTGSLALIRYQPMALGAPIYALSSLQRTFELYRREDVHDDWLRYSLYCAFFPRLVCGPLASYREFWRDAPPERLNLRQVLPALGVFIQGAFKAAILGRELYQLYLRLSGLSEPTVLSSWLLALSIALALYFTLSGLCDIAAGLASAFGFALPRNFYYPYQSRSVTDFFHRFNITYHRFLERTVYDELGGVGSDKLSGCLNILVTGLLAGLWFGLRINYLLWGAYLSLFVMAEHYLWPKMQERIPTLVNRGLTLLITLTSFALFSRETLVGSGRLIASMVNFHHVINDQALYLLASNWLLLLMGCLLATNGVSLLSGYFRKAAPRVSGVLLGLLDLGIFALYLALSI